MRRHPEIKSLFRNSWDDALNVFLLILMWTVQTSLALTQISFWLRLVLAWTVGAMCCHGIQALIHELCHGIGRKGRLSFFDLGPRLRLGFYVARFASTCCNFPWAMFVCCKYMYHVATVSTPFFVYPPSQVLRTISFPSPRLHGGCQRR